MSGDADTPEDRVLILAPSANDARLTARFLREAGLHAQICTEAAAFATAAREDCGAWLLAEEAIGLEFSALLGSVLAAQPSWSDVPIVIIASGGGDASSARRAHLVSFGLGGNVTILERPFHTSTLVSAMNAALRARRRQYQVRDLLQQSARQCGTEAALLFPIGTPGDYLARHRLKFPMDDTDR